MSLTTSAPSAAGPASAFNVFPSGAVLAAEVTDIDLRYLDARTFGRLLDAWHRHSVLLIRGQSLTDQDLIAFTSSPTLR